MFSSDVVKKVGRAIVIPISGWWLLWSGQFLELLERANPNQFSIIERFSWLTTLSTFIAWGLFGIAAYNALLLGVRWYLTTYYRSERVHAFDYWVTQVTLVAIFLALLIGGVFVIVNG